jgi:type III secretion system YscQ/HrcQ family protein
MLNLPKISGISAQYANVLARSNGEVTLSLHGTDYYLEFYDTTFTSYQAKVLLSFKADFQTYYLLLESFFFADYLKSFFPDLNLTEVNAEAKLILIDLAFEEAIATLKATLGVEKIEIESINLKPDQKKITALFAQDLMQFPFRICNDKDEKRNALLMMGTQNAADFLAKIDVSGHSTAATALDLKRLYAPVVLSLGFAKFMILELNRLRVGDVILIPTFKVATQGFYAHLWAQKQALFLVNIKDQDIIVEKKMDLSMVDEDEDFFDFSEEDDEGDDESFKELQDMISPTDLEEEKSEQVMPSAAAEVGASADPEPLEEPATSDLTHLNMTLNFVVGSQVMSLEELQKLSPGYHFNLNKSPTSPISILANGKDFATGELVQIEDKIGVKLTHINIKK